MADEPSTEVVGDSVPRYEDVAVGEDLAFQRRWWIFERAIWTVFLLILIADLLGAFGRGWLAKTEQEDLNQGLQIKYERIERAGTPSILTLQVTQTAIRNGQLNIFVSEDIIQRLGAQRISPQPLRSSLAQGGIDYSFPAIGSPAKIEFQLQPAFIGMHKFRIGIDGTQAKPIEGRVLVLP